MRNHKEVKENEMKGGSRKGQLIRMIENISDERTIRAIHAFVLNWRKRD